MNKEFEKITNHLINSGFVFQGSQIYGGLANSWDYGPLGVQLKNNIKNYWWKKFVQEEPLNVGLDSAILMNPKIWEASGHLSTFTDPLMDCKNCKSRFRADNLVEEHDPSLATANWTNEQFQEYIKKEHLKCPVCGKEDFTDIRKFQLMFKTFQGVVEDAKSVVYLRPETAQGIFVNFKNIQRATRKKVPFGVCQIGKVFRNEITPGNFIFRTREFEQMELEFFCEPGTDLEWYKYWKSTCMKFLNSVGLKEETLRFREHPKEDLAHYSKGTSDIEYLFPFGWGEVWGISDRTDFDLTRHQEYSKENLEYIVTETNTRYIPYVVEPSVGVDRLFLAVVCDAFDEEKINDNDSRIVMHFDKKIAPIQVAVLPLSKQLSAKSREIYSQIVKNYFCDYDEAGSIGKRYRRQDSVGTPLCITIDFDTLEDNAVTIRDRDTMQQIRISIDKLDEYLKDYFK